MFSALATSNRRPPDWISVAFFTQSPQYIRRYKLVKYIRNGDLFLRPAPQSLACISYAHAVHLRVYGLRPVPTLRRRSLRLFPDFPHAIRLP